MSALSSLADWKAGLSLLLTVAVAVWLNPLPVGAMVIVFLTLFATTHLLAAATSAIVRARRRKADRTRA